MAKGAYVGVDSEYYPAFADNTWAQIIKACQNNEVPSSWAVGDQKTMTINGKDYPIDIIGIKHDTYADGSGAAPLTFQMHDIYASSYAMNSSNTNRGGWESTAIRTTRLPAILALMPSEVQAGIKEVNKITGQGGSSFALKTTADKLFILSVNEIFGYEPSDVAKGEGAQYAYYADGNSTQKKQNGEYNYWWTRSPVANNSSGFFQVRTDGSRVSTNYPSGTYGVSFAFCFGGTSELNTEFPSLGSVARKVKKGYIGVPTLGDSLGGLEVGSTIKLNVDGVATDFLVVHQGNPDSSKYDASCDGTWLLMKDCYTSTYWDANTTTTTYSESSIHPYLNSDFFGLLDSNIQAVTKRVKLPYTLKTGTSGEVMSLENGVDTKVFLLATAEVGVGTGFSYNDGACIDYFAGTAEIDSKRIAYVKNASGNLAKTIWYLRTPQNSGQYLVDVVTTEGKGSNDWVNRNYGIRPALILPSSLALVNGTIDGTEAGYKDVARKIKKAYIGVNGVARLCWEAQPDIVSFTVYQNKTDAFTFTMPSGMTFDEAISAGYANGYNANGDTMILMNDNANGYLMRQIRYVAGQLRGSGSVYTDTSRATRAYITDTPIEGNFYDSSGGVVAS